MGSTFDRRFPNEQRPKLSAENKDCSKASRTLEPASSMKKILYFPLLVSKGICHCWKYYIYIYIAGNIIYIYIYFQGAYSQTEVLRTQTSMCSGRSTRTKGTSPEGLGEQRGPSEVPHHGILLLPRGAGAKLGTRNSGARAKKPDSRWFMWHHLFLPFFFLVAGFFPLRMVFHKKGSFSFRVSEQLRIMSILG